MVARASAAYATTPPYVPKTMPPVYTPPKFETTTTTTTSAYRTTTTTAYRTTPYTTRPGYTTTSGSPCETKPPPVYTTNPCETQPPPVYGTHTTPSPRGPCDQEGGCLPGTTRWIDSRLNKGLLVGAAVGALGAAAAGTGIGLSIANAKHHAKPPAPTPAPLPLTLPPALPPTLPPTTPQVFLAREQEPTEAPNGSSAVVALALAALVFFLCCIGLCIGLAMYMKPKKRGTAKTTTKTKDTRAAPSCAASSKRTLGTANGEGASHSRDFFFGARVS